MMSNVEEFLTHPNEAENTQALGDYLPVAVRCYTEKVTSARRTSWRKQRKVKPRPDRMLVLDTETATQETISRPHIMPGFDPKRWPPYAQGLLFGRAHLYVRMQDGKWKKVYEWLFYPDDLPEKAIRILEVRFRWMTYRMGDWREPCDEPGVKCYFMPLSEWLDAFYREAVGRECLIVGYNVPFDLSRIACHVGPAKTKWFAGGFSFVIWPDPSGKRKASLYRPRLYIRKIGGHSNSTQFASYKLGPEKDARRIKPRGEFLDLSQFVNALTGEAQTLESACQAFGLDITKRLVREHGVITLKYLLYNRQDVEMTFHLAVAALEEFDRHPISRGHHPPGELSETKVFSSASIAKAYLKHMSIKPRIVAQPKFPKNVIGCAMEAYYGGRVEIRARRVRLPVAHLDFFSMFPTINVLMDLWKFAIARRIEVVEDPEKAISFLDRVTHDDLFNRELWSSELARFVLIEPEGDILPVRARYQTGNRTWKIGVNPYTSDEPQWYALPDVVAAKLLTGKSPKILRSLRLVAHGVEEGLKPVDFRGEVSIDPAREDFFKKLVEERAKVKAGMPPYHDLTEAERHSLSLALKITANAGSYGIHAEVNREHLQDRRTAKQEIWHGGEQPIEMETARPEIPGLYSFPPLASLTTAGARLTLVMLERCVTDLRGAYAFMDTDSMDVIASKEGGRIEVVGSGRDGETHRQQARVLSWDEVQEIISPFEALNPYDRAAVPGSILELKKENFRGRDLSGEQVQLHAFCIAPKRYCLFTEQDGHREVVSRMESALGALRPPVEGDWITEWWEAILDNRMIPFADLPLVRRFSIGSWDILRRFQSLNRGRPYQAQVKPFSFFLATSPDSLMYQGKVGSLVAPYEPDPAEWENLSWIEYATGQEHRITTRLYIAATRENGRTAVQTFGSYFMRYRSLPCSEFLGPDGRPCGRETSGILERRPVRRLHTVLIGKETNELVLVDLGIEPSITLEVPWKADHWFDALRSVLCDVKVSEIARNLRVSERALQLWIAGKRTPSVEVRFQLESVCLEQVRKVFQDLHLPIPDHPTNAFLDYRRAVEKLRDQTEKEVFRLCEQYGVKPIARRLAVSNSSLRRWVGRGRLPERTSVLIQLHRALQVEQAV
ncbi:MAG: hypothetical protein IIA89_14235 [Chloroflexi bacterium]|nr:hypothetical protein [Chloroflexota bacterium]